MKQSPRKGVSGRCRRRERTVEQTTQRGALATTSPAAACIHPLRGFHLADGPPSTGLRPWLLSIALRAPDNSSFAEARIRAVCPSEGMPRFIARPHGPKQEALRVMLNSATRKVTCSIVLLR